MIMTDRLELMKSRYAEIISDLSNPEIAKDIKKMTDLSKEMKKLEKVVLVYDKYKNVLNTIKDLKELIKDEEELEIAELAKQELEEAYILENKLEEELKVMLLPKDINDDKDVIVEIRGAAGGDEANIFAGDLFRMYSKYAESKGWKIEVTNSIPSEMGGFSQIEFLVSGDMVYSLLKYESGAHRVQRVPETESQGRIQTSTATVLVMPESDDLEIEVDWNDIRVDTFCSSGPGGQSVNTTKSAVRLTYIPTGLSVACQEGKSQHENKATAFRLLKSRLYDQMLALKEEQEGAVRKKLVGRGDRSEKIRTYNYPQNRVTDHRISFTIQRLDAVMEGKLDLIINELINEDQKRQLQG